MEFFDVIKPFYIFSKIIGSYSFTLFPSCNKLNYKISFFNASYAFIASFLPMFISSLFNFEVFWVKVYPQMILVNLWDNIAKFGLAFPLLQVLYYQTKSRSMAEFYQKVTNFDLKCRKFGIFFEYKSDLKIVKMAVSSILFLTFFVVSLPVTQYILRIKMELTSTVSFIFQFFYMYYCTAHLFIVCRTVRTRLEKLNDYFQRSIFSSKKHTKQFLKLYNEHCDLIDHINNTFTMSIIFVMANEISMGTVGLYTLIVALNTLSYTYFWFVVFYTSMWIGTQFGLACFMANIGDLVKNEFYRSSLVATRRLNSSPNEGINEELRDFILELKCRCTKIECIFFTIDWHIIFAVTKINYVVKNFDLNFEFILILDDLNSFHLLDHHLANLQFRCFCVKCQ